MHLGVLIGDLGPVVKVCNGSGRPKAVRGHTDAYRIKDHVWSLAAVGERIAPHARSTHLTTVFLTGTGPRYH